MRVLAISNRYPPEIVGGAEILASQLCECLSSRGHDITVLTTRVRPGVMEKEIKGGVTVLRAWPGSGIFPNAGLPGWRRLLWQIPVHILDLVNPVFDRVVSRVIEEVKPDVIHTHNLYGLSLRSWVRADRARVPVVHTAHDCHLICPRGQILFDEDDARQSEKMVASLYRWWYLSRTEGIDVLCCPSRHHYDLHRRYGCRAGSYEIIPHGVGRGKGGMPEAGRSGDRSTLQVLYVGRIDRHKGIETLMRAISLVESAEVTFHIAGTGPLETEVRKLSSEKRNVRYHGFVDEAEKERLLQGADVLVLPSVFYESFGMAAAEALAAGVPAIVTDTGGQKEIVEDGETGRLFPPRDQHKLAGLIMAMAGDRRGLEEMKRKAREAGANFDILRMTRRYEEVYQKVAS